MDKEPYMVVELTLLYRVRARDDHVRVMPHPNTTTTYTKHVITPPIWTQSRRQLKKSNRAKKAHLLAIAKLQKSMVWTVVRSLEDTRAKLNLTNSLIFPSTYNTRRSLYDILKYLLRGVFYL